MSGLITFSGGKESLDKICRKSHIFWKQWTLHECFVPWAFPASFSFQILLSCVTINSDGRMNFGASRISLSACFGASYI